MIYTIDIINHTNIIMSRIGTTTISCTIPKDLGEQLNLVAEIEERNKSYYVKKALEVFLKERLEDAMLSKMGEDAYKEFVTSGEDPVSYESIRKELLDK